MFKEVNILRSSYILIPYVSAPMAEVSFILTAKHSPPHGMWWIEVRPHTETYEASTEETFIPHLNLGLHCEILCPA